MCPCKLIRLRYDSLSKGSSHLIRRSEVVGGGGSTMEERLDMETERSGIVSANATVRRRRRSSPKLQMVLLNCDGEKPHRHICQVHMGELYTVWTGGCDHHYCSGETWIEISCHASSVPFTTMNPAPRESD